MAALKMRKAIAWTLRGVACFPVYGAENGGDDLPVLVMAVMSVFGNEIVDLEAVAADIYRAWRNSAALSLSQTSLTLAS